MSSISAGRGSGGFRRWNLVPNTPRSIRLVVRHSWVSSAEKCEFFPKGVFTTVAQMAVALRTLRDCGNPAMGHQE